jgi:CSLREA domain-containing protein
VLSSGTLTNAAGGVIDVNEGSGGARSITASLTNYGTVNAATSLTLGRSGAHHTNSGTFKITAASATATITGSAFDNVVGGNLAGLGRVDVSRLDFTNDGDVSPGLSPGVLNLAGDYPQGSSGALKIEIGGAAAGSEFDVFNVTGIATLAGTIRVDLISGFMPVADQTFQVMTYGSRIGEITTIVTTIDGLPTDDVTFTATYNPNDLTLVARREATFTVNSTADPGSDGVCDLTECTLREAIDAANDNPFIDKIAFDIPGAGPHTIQLGSNLPVVSDPVFIDGYTQPGAIPNTNAPPLGSDAVVNVELRGASGIDVGLRISAGNSTVRGLAINSFDGAGIVLEGNGGNLVAGNFVGTDAGGNPGVGNAGSGVAIIGSTDNTIGGTSVELRNLISGNGQHGIDISGLGATGNAVLGNLIGTTLDGIGDLGNAANGVSVSSSDNMIGAHEEGAANTIAFNGGDGVSVLSNGSPSATGVAVLSNSIFGNSGLGIDLGTDGVTPNDDGDGDGGANNLQNFPVLSSVDLVASTTIEGIINSTANTDFSLEFFANTACDPSGFGEGELLFGRTDVVTDGSGDASFTITFDATVPEDHYITASATDPANNTSEFSACLVVMPEVDRDGDGIEDQIDGRFIDGEFVDESDTPSNNFTDQHLGGFSGGRISDAGEQMLTISEEPNPYGVRIGADPSGGATPAAVSMCGGSETWVLTGGDEVVATCSSTGGTGVDAISGPVEGQLGPDFVMTLLSGATVGLIEEGGQFRISNESPPDSGPIVLTFHGVVVSVLGAGESVLQGELEIKFARVIRHRRVGRDQFGALGWISLGPEDDGLDVRSEEITVTFDGFSETIPVGPERRMFGGRWLTLLAGDKVQLLVWSRGRFGIHIHGLDLSDLDLAEPVPLSLQIGNDLPMTAIPFDEHGRFFTDQWHAAMAAPPAAEASAGVEDADLIAAPDSVAVAPGHAATYDVLVSPLGVFFDKEVTLSCSGLPGEAECSFAPSTVTVDAAGAASILTVSTAGRLASAPPGTRPGRLPLETLWLSLAALVLLGGLTLANKHTTFRRVLVYGPMTLLLLLAALFTACKQDMTAPTGIAATPLGTHSFTITATANDVERSIPATLVVRLAGEGSQLYDGR